MTFKENARLDTSQVGAGGGRGRVGGGGLAAGGGLGGLLLLILYMVFGGDLGGTGGGATTGSPWNFSGSQVSGTDGSSGEEAFAHCVDGADANEHLDCRMVGTVNSVQAFWGDAMDGYEPARTILFQDVVETGCGTANSQVGPFYCPLDNRVYIDISFFQQLERMGGDGGTLSQMYVVAHEYGHHVENILGLLARARDGQTGPLSGGVRIELMADCFAGVWAHHASTTEDADGNRLLKELTEADIRSALSAAAAVGDDHIQQSSGGGVNPDTWTHGSSESRQRWFLTGYQSGQPAQCDTFSTNQL